MKFSGSNAVDPKTLGQRIRRLREDQRLTQYDLAEKMQVDQRTISDLENGRRRLAVTELDDLAAALDVTVYHFLRDELNQDDLDQLLLDYFHRLPNHDTRQAAIAFLRILSELYQG